MVNDLSINMSAEEEFKNLSSSLGADGIGTTALKAINNNADKMVPIYHAITNYSHQVPYYMVDTSEGASLLKRVFTDSDVNLSQLDPKWSGKRVWFLAPQPVVNDIGDFYCSFSVNQPKEQQEQARAQGFSSDCRKSVVFKSRYDMENHRRLRHPRRHSAMERWDNERRADDVARANTINAQALAALTAMVSNQNESRPVIKGQREQVAVVTPELSV